MSIVIGVRVPKRLKEDLERLGINYSREIRNFLERRVREEKLKLVLRKIKRIRQNIGQIDGNLVSLFMNEERDRL